MTTIACLRTHLVRVRLRFPFVTSLRTATHAESLLVEVVDSDGASGWGECPQVWRVTGESLAGARACVEGPLADAVTSLDADDLTGATAAVAAAVEGNASAKGAVDVALHDLAAVRLGVPLVRLLGGPAGRQAVATDVTVSAGETDAIAAAARERVADGFGTLKLKVGTDAGTDVERVRAVAAAAGPDVALRLDANQGWTAKEAVRVMSTLEDAGVAIELVEQPVPAHDLAGLAHVTATIATPVLADEAVYGLRDLAELIRARAADLVNLKLAKTGGLTQAVAMVRLAHAYEVGTMVGSMMESQVGVGAAAALVAAHTHPTGARLWRLADLDASWWLTRSPVAGGPVADGAAVVLPDAPGLGILGLSEPLESQEDDPS